MPLIGYASNSFVRCSSHQKGREVDGSPPTAQSPLSPLIVFPTSRPLLSPRSPQNTPRVLFSYLLSHKYKIVKKRKDIVRSTLLHLILRSFENKIEISPSEPTYYGFSKQENSPCRTTMSTWSSIKYIDESRWCNSWWNQYLKISIFPFNVLYSIWNETSSFLGTGRVSRLNADWQGEWKKRYHSTGKWYYNFS